MTFSSWIMQNIFFIFAVNESTNQRVVLWAFFEALLICVMSIGQVYYLKRFFEVRRMVWVTRTDSWAPRIFFCALSALSSLHVSIQRPFFSQVCFVSSCLICSLFAGRRRTLFCSLNALFSSIPYDEIISACLNAWNWMHVGYRFLVRWLDNTNSNHTAADGFISQIPFCSYEVYFKNSFLNPFL